MSRIGTVLEHHGSEVTVTTSRRGVCEGCTEKNGCAFDSGFSGAKTELVTVIDPIGTRPGDTVEFDLPGHTELKLSLLVWMVPLLGLILGALGGSLVHSRLGIPVDASTLVGAGIGFGLAFIPVMVADRRSAGNQRVVPVVSRVISAPACQPPDSA